MFGLYVHIPFCATKCRYCDFNSVPANDRLIREYLRALAEEIRSFSRGNDRIIDTVYIGGGTPTVLSLEQLEELFDAIFSNLHVARGAEVTVEANPDSIDHLKTEMLISLGAGRVSLGVQSLRDGILRKLGRSHTSDEALEAMLTLRRGGFGNIGADLIFALPGQTVGAWEEDLGRLLELRPDHLSLYGLSLEEGTPLYHDVSEGRLSLPSEDDYVAMFRAASRIAADAGYEHYEISNYSLPGFRSRHNSIYWTGGEYYGAGAGAHSYFRRPMPVRSSNVANPEEYVARWRGGLAPTGMRDIVTRRTHLAEMLMLGLRLSCGIDVRLFSADYGENPLVFFEQELAGGFRKGWLELDAGRLRLTGEGVLFSNEVFSALF